MSEKTLQIVRDMFPLLRELVERRRGIFGSVTQTFLVQANKKPTYFRIDGAEPMEGNVPFTFHIWGYLMGIQPDGSEVGVGGKIVKLWAKKPGQATFTKIWEGYNGSWPNPDGWIDWLVTIDKGGQWEIYGEFAGDDEWEGCP